MSSVHIHTHKSAVLVATLSVIQHKTPQGRHLVCSNGIACIKNEMFHNTSKHVQCLAKPRPLTCSPCSRCVMNSGMLMRSLQRSSSTSMHSKAALRSSKPSSILCLNGPRSTSLHTQTVSALGKIGCRSVVICFSPLPFVAVLC